MSLRLRTTNDDQAARLTAVEMISALLASTGPEQLGQELTQQLRELTGARTVLLLSHQSHGPAHELIYASPLRRTTLFTTEELRRFRPDRTPGPLPLFPADLPPEHPLRAPLLGAGVESVVRIPLRAGSETVGWVMLLDVPEPDRIGEAIHVITLLSPVIALTLKNAIAHAQLEASNRELEAFAYSVSHDLRAPLRAINGFSEIITDEYSDVLDAEGKRLLHIVRSNARQMDGLITALLNLSRVIRVELRLVTIGMDELADAAYRNSASPETQAQIEFVTSSMPPASGDPNLVGQVWRNLIGNAVKYTGPTAGRRIEVGGYERDEMNIYFVKDNGVGFDPTYSHKLFGVFQRLHEFTEFEGTGIGLAIVQRVVERHGGRAWAESQVGDGATFWFTLPSGGEDR